MNQHKLNIHHNILRHMLRMKYDKEDRYFLIGIHLCHMKMNRYMMLNDIN